MIKNKIIEAAQFAKHAHKGQFRKWNHADMPYIIHPVRIAGKVMLREDATEEMVSAALLHDVLEDTNVTHEDLVVRFGVKVARMVVDMTNTTKGMDASRVERKTLDRVRISKVSNEVKVIKLYDRIDNLVEMDGAPYDFVKKYRKESILLLNEALSGVDQELEIQLRSLAE